MWWLWHFLMALISSSCMRRTDNKNILIYNIWLYFVPCDNFCRIDNSPNFRPSEYNCYIFFNDNYLWIIPTILLKTFFWTHYEKKISSMLKYGPLVYFWYFQDIFRMNAKYCIVLRPTTVLHEGLHSTSQIFFRCSTL